MALLAASCRPSAATALETPTSSQTTGLALESPSASPATAPALPVIFDDDGSPDGTTALLYLLSHPSVDLRGASVSFGEAYPETYIQHFGRLIDAYGKADVPLGAGEAAPLAGNNMFPEAMRLAANDFWGFPLPHPDRTYPAEVAANMMVSVVNGSQEPVTIFVSGPATNLARALRQEPDLAANIQAVVMMGGAVHVPGNIHDLIRDSENEVAEWNVYADPQAAREVLASGVPIVMVPLDATNQVSVDRDDTSGWRDGGPGADLAAEIYDSLMSNWGTDRAAIWDLMTAAIMTDRSLCGFEALALDVVTADGPTSGQTVILPGGQPNVSVCLEPDVERIMQTLVEVFSSGG
ncbi:MAG TPA: nucleoside hydrolase [Anaerolineales bacterium]|nr:nucleoside hydrolase [Anaerolineales bacterium]